MDSEDPLGKVDRSHPQAAAQPLHWDIPRLDPGIAGRPADANQAEGLARAQEGRLSPQLGHGGPVGGMSPDRREGGHTGPLAAEEGCFSSHGKDATMKRQVLLGPGRF